jgi:hypothetical protein
MKETTRDRAGSLLILAGFSSFLAFLPAALPWLLPPLLLFLFSRLRRRGSVAAFMPFASGLLAWPMRLFYWDRFDLALRVRNLLVLAVLFAVYLLARKGRWRRRFLRRFNSLALKKRLLAVFYRRRGAVCPGIRPPDPPRCRPGRRRAPLPGRQPVPGPRRRP